MENNDKNQVLPQIDGRLSNEEAFKAGIIYGQMLYQKQKENPQQETQNSELLKLKKNIIINMIESNENLLPAPSLSKQAKEQNNMPSLPNNQYPSKRELDQKAKEAEKNITERIENVKNSNNNSEPKKKCLCPKVKTSKDCPCCIKISCILFVSFCSLLYTALVVLLFTCSFYITKYCNDDHSKCKEDESLGFAIYIFSIPFLCLDLIVIAFSVIFCTSPAPNENNCNLTLPIFHLIHSTFGIITGFTGMSLSKKYYNKDYGFYSFHLFKFISPISLILFVFSIIFIIFSKKIKEKMK